MECAGYGGIGVKSLSALKQQCKLEIPNFRGVRRLLSQLRTSVTDVDCGDHFPFHGLARNDIGDYRTNIHLEGLAWKRYHHR